MNEPIVYTLDSETDPFLQGREPRPFAWGLYCADGSYHQTWGENCTADMMAILSSLPHGIVYIHNGGKFDIFFLLRYINQEKKMLIIDGRITQCFVTASNGLHRVRDSYKILPFALKQYDKTDIDYAKMEADVREQNKDEIQAYLKDDCLYLYQLCSEYVKTFGPAITIGCTAMKELKARHDVLEPLTPENDAAIRSRYFVGGRVERYKTGVYDGAWKVYDVNSMYPYVMSAFYHPVGNPSLFGNEITKDTFFVTALGYSHGCFPTRDKHGVTFRTGYGEYSVSIHEWDAAMELGLFECEQIIETVDFEHSRMFDDYITHFYIKRKRAKETGDKIKAIFYKFLLNNSYGKFAVNPEHFRESIITDDTFDMRWEGYKAAYMMAEFGLIIWEKPAQEFKYANVGTGASITGAARSVLMRGLQKAVNPMYCDTDCIICEDLPGVVLHASELGAWDTEKTGDRLAIAGRKLYALWEGSTCVKSACKGVNITPEQITSVAQGEMVTYERDAPTYKLNGAVEWITRNVRST